MDSVKNQKIEPHLQKQRSRSSTQIKIASGFVPKPKPKKREVNPSPMKLKNKFNKNDEEYCVSCPSSDVEEEDFQLNAKENWNKEQNDIKNKNIDDIDKVINIDEMIKASTPKNYKKIENVQAIRKELKNLKANFPLEDPTEIVDSLYENRMYEDFDIDQYEKRFRANTVRKSSKKYKKTQFTEVIKNYFNDCGQVDTTTQSPECIYKTGNEDVKRFSLDNSMSLCKSSTFNQSLYEKSINDNSHNSNTKKNRVSLLNILETTSQLRRSTHSKVPKFKSVVLE